jgi:hypothetical protein
MFFLGLLAAIATAIMYVTALGSLISALESEQPELLELARSGTIFPVTKRKAAYRILSRSKNGAFQSVTLSNSVLAQTNVAKRRLYIYVACFLVLLFGFLGYSLVGHGPQA